MSAFSVLIGAGILSSDSDSRLFGVIPTQQFYLIYTPALACPTCAGDKTENCRKRHSQACLRQRLDTPVCAFSTRSRLIL